MGPGGSAPAFAVPEEEGLLFRVPVAQPCAQELSDALTSREQTEAQGLIRKFVAAAERAMEPNFEVSCALKLSTDRS